MSQCLNSRNLSKQPHVFLSPPPSFFLLRYFSFSSHFSEVFPTCSVGQTPPSPSSAESQKSPKWLQQDTKDTMDTMDTKDTKDTSLTNQRTLSWINISEKVFNDFF